MKYIDIELSEMEADERNHISVRAWNTQGASYGAFVESLDAAITWIDEQFSDPENLAVEIEDVNDYALLATKKIGDPLEALGKIKN